MAWSLFWQIVVLMVLATLLALIFVSALQAPSRKEKS